MKNQKNLIEEVNWDCLIILDACRYDYFEEAYRNYFSGELQRVVSAGDRTPVWLKRIFEDEDYSDVVYISATPYVNSKGVEKEGFNATKYFYKVIDAWDIGWDDKLKNVPPGSVAKITTFARAKYPEKRLISHFMQPHEPYFLFGAMGKGASRAVRRVNEGKDKKKILIEKFREIIGKTAEKLLGRMQVYKIRRAMNLKGFSETEKIALRHGGKVLQEAYKKNLERVLEEVAGIVDRLPGKIVITSDHAELLGEDGLYGHRREFEHSLLREVPWLAIKD